MANTFQGYKVVRAYPDSAALFSCSGNALGRGECMYFIGQSTYPPEYCGPLGVFGSWDKAFNFLFGGMLPGRWHSYEIYECLYDHDPIATAFYTGTLREFKPEPELGSIFASRVVLIKKAWGHDG